MEPFSDQARRVRLARRHALHPDHWVGDALAATRAMTALHATEPHTVHLTIAARTRDQRPPDVDVALYGQRSVVKQLAMRRTLFAFPRDLLPFALGSASARVAAHTAAQLAKDLTAHGVTDDGAAWIERGAAAVIAALADGGAKTAAELRAALPQLDGRTRAGNKRWEVSTPFAPRLLTVLGAQGVLMRGENAGHWRTSRPRWTLAQTWLGTQPKPTDAATGYAELVRRWLFTFGPGTVADLQWWLGSTKAAVRAALAEVQADQVLLDSGSTGYVLPGDGPARDEAEITAWAALLPVLDPTVMGWRERTFYLDDDLVPQLFDRNGNAGTTAWVNGRVVGCWVQEPDATVRVVPCRDLLPSEHQLLAQQARRLTEFLDGVVISPVYVSPLMAASRP